LLRSPAEKIKAWQDLNLAVQLAQKLDRHAEAQE
jgi:hypothetical protein